MKTDERKQQQTTRSDKTGHVARKTSVQLMSFETNWKQGEMDARQQAGSFSRHPGTKALHGSKYNIVPPPVSDCLHFKGDQRIQPSAHPPPRGCWSRPASFDGCFSWLLLSTLSPKTTDQVELAVALRRWITPVTDKGSHNHKVQM